VGRRFVNFVKKSIEHTEIGFDNLEQLASSLQVRPEGSSWPA
jgi:hypothetical protein